LAELITKLWSPKPDQRPDCATLLKMVREVEANYQSNKEEWDSIVNTVECLSMSTDEMSLSSGSSTPSVSPLFNMGGTSGPYGPGSLSVRILLNLALSESATLLISLTWRPHSQVVSIPPLLILRTRERVPRGQVAAR
jgi:hypothetical protein